MNTRTLALAALFIALGLILPFLTGQIPQIGSMLLPMHLPVLISGFALGGPIGFVVGLITPLLRSSIYGMPPLMSALAMAPELATYGLVSGLMYRRLRDMRPVLTRSLIALILAMITGRFVWGVAMWGILAFSGTRFPIQAFFAGAFANAMPGIILQLLLVPALVSALEQRGLIR